MMSSRVAERLKIVRDFGSEGGRDTGSSAVQIALLTADIDRLRQHFARHRKDHQGRRGLLALVSRRRRLLRYLRGRDRGRYDELLGLLGLRR